MNFSKISITLVLVVLVGGTYFAINSNSKLTESKGTVVALTAEDKAFVSWAYDYMEDWAAWETKGDRLFNAGEYDQALYAYHQALSAWPKSLPDDAPALQKQSYHKEPTDTLLKLGLLYEKTNKSTLAKYYFERTLKYDPGNSIAKREV